MCGTPSSHPSRHTIKTHNNVYSECLIQPVNCLSLSHLRKNRAAPAEKISVGRNKHNTLVEPPVRLPQKTAFMFGYKSINWKYTSLIGAAGVFCGRKASSNCERLCSPCFPPSTSPLVCVHVFICVCVCAAVWQVGGLR